MWICSQLGFFSIVRKPDGWHVRARLRADLQGLLAAAGLDLPVQEWPQADYRWRVIAEAGQVTAVFAALAASVDYPNFKSRIAALPGQRAKLEAYHGLWHELHRLQEEA